MYARIIKKSRKAEYLHKYYDLFRQEGTYSNYSRGNLVHRMGGVVSTPLRVYRGQRIHIDKTFQDIARSMATI